LPFSRQRRPSPLSLSLSLSSQVHELHARHSAEAMKAEKWQFEYKNLHDKFDAMQKEKEVSWRNIVGK